MEQNNKLIILQPARDDIFDITNYHQLISGASSALEIAREIKHALSLLKEFPLLGTVHDDPLLAKQGYRKFRINKFYACTYKVFDNVVYIYTVTYNNKQKTGILN